MDIAGVEHSDVKMEGAAPFPSKEVIEMEKEEEEENKKKSLNHAENYGMCKQLR